MRRGLRHDSARGRLSNMQDEAPRWWRPLWGLATLAIVTLLMIDDDYSMLVPSLAAFCGACFGFEYLVKQNGHKPPD